MKGKIVALCIAGMFLLAGLAGMAAAKKPDNLTLTVSD